MRKNLKIKFENGKTISLIIYNAQGNYFGELLLNDVIQTSKTGFTFLSETFKDTTEKGLIKKIEEFIKGKTIVSFVITDNK